MEYNWTWLWRQPTHGLRAFRGCQRGGARKLSLLMVMCDWLMKTKNQGLLQCLITQRYFTTLTYFTLLCFTLLYFTLPYLTLQVCSKAAARMESKRYKNREYQEGKDHLHLWDSGYNTHIHLFSRVTYFWPTLYNHSLYPPILCHRAGWLHYSGNYCPVWLLAVWFNYLNELGKHCQL